MTNAPNLPTSYQQYEAFIVCILVLFARFWAGRKMRQKKGGDLN